MKRMMLALLAAIAMLAASGCGDDDSGDPSGDASTDTDTDSDSDTDVDTDTDTDSDSDTDSATDSDGGVAPDMTDCEGGKLDPLTNLCWQNPPSTDAFTWADAVTYCDNLFLGSHDDWRLPMIQELISLLRGCVGGTETGDLSTSTCGVTDPDCLENSCWDADPCEWCDQLGGPDDNPEGCYWDTELEGTCYGYWSSSSYVDDESYRWYVLFNVGGAYYGDVSYIGESVTGPARCVRGGP
jgi:hypothetical protein